MFVCQVYFRFDGHFEFDHKKVIFFPIFLFYGRIIIVILWFSFLNKLIQIAEISEQHRFRDVALISKLPMFIDVNKT